MTTPAERNVTDQPIDATTALRRLVAAHAVMHALREHRQRLSDLLRELDGEFNHYSIAKDQLVRTIDTLADTHPEQFNVHLLDSTARFMVVTQGVVDAAVNEAEAFLAVTREHGGVEP